MLRPRKGYPREPHGAHLSPISPPPLQCRFCQFEHHYGCPECQNCIPIQQKK